MSQPTTKPRRRSSLKAKEAEASAAASASASASESAPDAAGEVFDIDDFTCASPFEKFVSVLEETMHIWRVGVMHPHAPDIAAAAPSAAPAASSSSAATASPGLPLQQTLVVLSGRSFQLSLYHSTPSFSHASSHTRNPSALSSTSATALLALPLRVDHVSAASGGHHPITVCFGVSSFLLLTPAATHVESPQGRNNNAHAAVLTPSTRRVSKNEASMLLSAVSIATNSAHCILPCFVAVDEGVKQLYWGRTCYGSVVRFDARCADEIPTAFRHLTGLTDAFQQQRERLEGRGVQTGNARTLVAVSFGYQQETRKWGYSDIGALRGLDADPDDDDACRWRDVSEDALIGFGAQWGPRDDPLLAVRLTTAWPFFPEGTFVDNAVYSDLDGFSAPNWRVDVEWRRDESINPIYSAFTPLTSALQIMIDISQQGGKLPSLASVLGNVPDTPSTLARQQSDNAGNDAHPLSALRAVQSSLKAHIEDANKIAAHGESVSEEHIDRVMKELLDIEHAAGIASPRPPAAASPSPVAPTFPFLPVTPLDPFSTSPYAASPADPASSAQLVPYGSLLSRFVFALLETADSNQLTLRTVAAMWTELVCELRFHFETGLPIPKLLSTDSPDFGCSILHQKIQLLQRCIRIQGDKSPRRKKANASSSAASSTHSSSSKSAPNWKEPWKSTAWSEERLSGGASSIASPDESGWGDLDDLAIGDDSTTTRKQSSSGWGELDISIEHNDGESDEEDAAADSSRAPEGVDSVLTTMHLLLTNAPMRAPLTQEVRVMTSDKFDEQQEMFARMGSSAESSRLRTEMQTAGLSSDMQAFKAANPGCILEDFVRWHSPKDWRALPAAAGNSARRGELSQRMRKRPSTEPANIWQKLWKGATPVTAAQQTQLFDPAVEGEQLLNYLENVEPSLLFSQLLGISLQNCLCLMARTRGVAEQLQPVTSAIQKLGHYLKNYNRGNIPQDLHFDFSACELLCAKATSLLLCLPECTVPSSPDVDAAGKPTTDKNAAGREMIAQLLAHGSYDVGHVGVDRAQLSSLFTCATARSKATSLFRTKPFNYAQQRDAPSSGGGAVMDSASGGASSLPKPDWSEFTFFAPWTPQASQRDATHGNTVPLVGSRTYVCLRHTQAALQTTNSAFPMPKYRCCTALLTQTSGEA